MPSHAEATRATPTFPDLLRGWRKIRKLSQLSLAVTAGVSQRHLSFLESGRSAPSRDMVLTLAKALELPFREQNALLNAAGFAAIYSENRIDQGELRQAKHAVSVMLEYHEPYPAIVIDRNWNILMLNDATSRMIGLFIDPAAMWEEIAPGKPPNALRSTLHPKGMQPYIANWQAFGAYFNHQLSNELSNNPYNREARELLDEIRGYPHMPAPDISANPVQPFMPLILEKGDIRLEFFTVISTFGTPLDVTLQEIRIETFFPGDEQTEATLQRLARQTTA